jgi:ppGpp synthetase/RelA/SpoT-type nucleotidyltranferase
MKTLFGDEGAMMGDVRREISKTIAILRPAFDDFHAEVLRELSSFRHEPQNRDIVYRLYSRSDKQRGGDAIKGIDAIFRKLEKWREDGGKWDVVDVHDIVAWTIVTYFRSEIDPLIERLRKPGVFTCFKLGAVRETSRNGYYAYHIELEGTGRFKVRRLKGELQIKSLLSDGWATRTRNLSYRTNTRIDPAIESMISSIGDMIQNLERQSDNLRDLITRNEQLEKERRNSAIKTLTYALIKAEQPEHGEPYARLAKAVYGEPETVCESRPEGKDFISIVEKWRRLTKKGGHSLSSSRFIVFLAVLRTPRDIDDIAIQAVETWISRAENGEYIRALAFRAWAYWALDDIDGAVGAAEEWLRHVQAAEFESADEQASRLRSAILENAYYRAERVFANPSTSDSEVERGYIRTLLNDAPLAPSERQRMVDQDTLGAILIMIAENARELSEGKRLCDAAYKWGKKSSSDHEVFREFHNLHLQRYKRRFEEFD